MINQTLHPTLQVHLTTSKLLAKLVANKNLKQSPKLDFVEAVINFYLSFYRIDPHRSLEKGFLLPWYSTLNL
jgi:hypothetical protein